MDFLNPNAVGNDFNTNRRYGEDAVKPAADLLALRKQLDAMLQSGQPKPDALAQPVNTVRDVLEVLKRFYRAGTAAGGGSGSGGIQSVNGKTDTNVTLNAGEIPSTGPSTVQADLNNLLAAIGGIEQKAYFNGATMTPGTASTSASATKGIFFTPDYDCTITAVWASIDAAAGTDSYQGVIAQVASIPSGAVVGTPSNTNAGTTGTTNARGIRFVFPSPITLMAGTPYFIGTVINGGTGTTINRVGAISAGTSNIVSLNAPGETSTLYARFDTNALANGNTPSATGEAPYNVWIEGYFTPP